jgi:phosphate transport system substrate-binding protein
MSRLAKAVTICVCLSVFIIACRNKNQRYDSPLKGKIFISVDESFKPVIAEQIKVYESSYPEAQIVANYEPEADCFRDLQNDSTRMIIVSRGLTDDENEYYKQKLSYKAQWDVLAYDAVAVIVNRQSKDSLFTIEKLKSYLNGTDTGKLIAFDGRKATSTVRLLQDSLLKGAPFGKNVMAAQSSKELIDYVAANIDAIGFIGTSWVADQDDTAQQRNSKFIRMALIECKNCDKGVYAKPSPATIAAGEYPLVRPLFFILKENFTGMGTGFVNFLSLERGQLVFRRSYLVPAKMNFNVRKSLMESNKNLLNKTTE